MFKNIFPDKLSKLVYKKDGASERESVASEAMAAIEAQKKDPASPEALQKEAKELIKSIDVFAKQIEEDLNGNTKEGLKYKIDLNKPASYASLQENMFTVEVWYALKRLAAARSALEVTAGRSNEASRTNLEFARIEIESARAFYKEATFLYDPLRVAASRPENAAFSDVSRAMSRSAESALRAQQQSRETKEVSNWSKMAKLVEEYLFLGNTALDKARKAKIQAELVTLADKTLVDKEGKKVMRLAQGSLVITRAPGEGTPAFMFDINLTRKIASGAAKRYRERMFAGGSKRDFPSAAPIV